MAPLSRRRRELDLASRQIANAPEPTQQTSLNAPAPAPASVLAPASFDKERDGHVHKAGRHREDGLEERDMRDILRPRVGERSTVSSKEEEDVNHASNGKNMEANVSCGSLTVEGSVQLPSYEQSLDSRDHQQSRQTSFLLQVEGLDDKGYRKLTFDDDLDLKEVIREKLQREEAGVGVEDKKTRFSDLVFTPRLTIFDRFNSERSPFRGLHTLFWLGMFFMVIKIGARNWNLHGSILGGNEVLAGILQRDLLILGLSDGILCASTAFSLLLQRLILSGYLSWDRQGWIIQNVSIYLISHQHNQYLLCKSRMIESTQRQRLVVV